MPENLLDLVELCKEDERYRYELWERFRPLCITWARKFKQAEDEEQDLLQESYVLLVNTLKTYDREKAIAFEAYYKCILYRWGNNYRRKKRILCTYDGEAHDLIGELVDETINVEEAVIRNERLTKLRQALKELKAKEYELIMALYTPHAKIAEIAQEKQMTYKALSHKKYKLLKKIEKILGEI